MAVVPLYHWFPVATLLVKIMEPVPQIAVDAKGRITSASSGTAGGGNFAPPATAPAASGEIIYIGTGTGLTAGKVYYLAANQAWTLANALNTTNSTSMLAIALGTSPAAGMLVRGYAKYSLTHYTSIAANSYGIPRYLSTTNGDFTATAPNASGNVVRILGYGVTAGCLYFNPDNTWVELV
jgi:hypothetical protein